MPGSTGVTKEIPPRVSLAGLTAEAAQHRCGVLAAPRASDNAHAPQCATFRGRKGTLMSHFLRRGDVGIPRRTHRRAARAPLTTLDEPGISLAARRDGGVPWVPPGSGRKPRTTSLTAIPASSPRRNSVDRSHTTSRSPPEPGSGHTRRVDSPVSSSPPVAERWTTRQPSARINREAFSPRCAEGPG